MPNIKSAKKRVKITLKEKLQNNTHRASMKTAVKKVEKLNNVSKEEAKKTLDIATKKIDKALAKGILHKNTAARQKSRLTKKVNNMK
jgi:small subunit ribosomal protein S20